MTVSKNVPLQILFVAKAITTNQKIDSGVCADDIILINSLCEHNSLCSAIIMNKDEHLGRL